MIAAALLALLGASPTEVCRDAFDRLDYEGAARDCRRAVQAAPPQQLAGLYRLLGLSLASIGDDAGAYLAFVSYLALDPAAELSSSVSPRLRAPFDRAKQAGAGAEVRVHAERVLPCRVGAPLRLQLRSEDGPAAPVQALRATVAGVDAVAPRAAGPTSLELPPPARAGTLVVALSALDTFGGALTTVPFDVDVAPRVEPRPWALSWPVWAGASVAIAAVATALGIYARYQSGIAETLSVASLAHERVVRATATGYAADAGWGLAGAVAIAAVVLWATDPSRQP